MDRQTVLRTITIGFGLMILLVLAAAYFGYEQSRSIQDNAQDLVREHLVNSDRGAVLESKIEQDSEKLLGELIWLMSGCMILAIGGSAFTVWFANQAFRRLERQTAELNQVSWHLIDTHEKISRRFSHEMHDELGQTLTGLKGLVKRATAADLEARREEMLDVLDEVMRDVRELSQLLRPVILDDFGLDAGIRWLVERFRQRTRIEVTYQSDFNGRMGELIETHLFRIAQEALTNIARHSGATQARISLSVSQDTVKLSIEDNGQGLPAEQKSGGLGMVGIRARVRQLDGKLKIENRPEGGLRIQVRAPFRPHHADDQEDQGFAS
jgi:signal transduction histidine kinase